MRHRDRLEAIVRADPDLTTLLERLRDLALPQWRLVAGCLYQTVWNVLTGRPRGTGIKDYDVAYYDAGDLSWDAEDTIIRRATARTRGCVGPVEVRNQARVHIWFQDRFGFAYPRLGSTDQALGYYASIVHAVGVRLESDGRLDIVAPFGFDDMFELVVRPNYALPNGASHDSKAARAKAIWPEVTVVRWQTDQGHSPAVGPGSIFPAAEDDAGNILKGSLAP